MLVLSILALSQFIFVPSRRSGVVADYTFRKIYLSKWVTYCCCDRLGSLPTSSCIFLLSTTFLLDLHAWLQVYDAALRWLKHDETNRLQHKKDLLAKIRFPLVTRKYLTTEVHNEPIIQDSCHCLKMVMGKNKCNISTQKFWQHGCDHINLLGREFSQQYASRIPQNLEFSKGAPFFYSSLNYSILHIVGTTVKNPSTW